MKKKKSLVSTKFKLSKENIHQAYSENLYSYLLDYAQQKKHLTIINFILPQVYCGVYERV